MDFPQSLKYTKDHEWIETAAASAKIGVTAYAIDQLGDIVHVELPQVGESFTAGSAFGTIESTKTVSDLYMPIAGKVVEVNKAAVGKPESLQEDPYKNGWLVKIEVQGKADLSKLLDAKAYATYVAEHAD
jgi:glycine cleavage system H protein